MLSYVLLNGGAWLVRKLTCGAFVPPNYDLAERWVIPPGGIVPGWVKYLAGTRAQDDVMLHERKSSSPSLDERSHTKAESLTMSDVNQLPSQVRQ